MGGTILNMITVAIGSALGLWAGGRFPQKTQQQVVFGLGLVTLILGIGNAQQTGNILIPALSIAIGVIIGEALDIDAALNRFGGWLQARISRTPTTPEGAAAAPLDDASAALAARARFINGFVTASLIFCIGPLTFVGSMQDGMGLPGGFQQLAIKSTLDFFASMAFAASLGIGVGFSVITILVVQGGLALVGSVAGQFMSDAMIAEMTGAGGLLLIGIALILMDIKRPKMANFLPALILAPIMVAAAAALGLDITP